MNSKILRDAPSSTTGQKRPGQQSIVIASAFALSYSLAYLWAGMHAGAMFLDGVPTLLMVPLLLHAARRGVYALLQRSGQSEPALAAFARYEPWANAVFLAGAVALLLGAAPSFALTLGLSLIVAGVQAVLFFALIGRAGRLTLAVSHHYIALLFLISGFSALIYQVVWQRTLFVTFGINSESVTVIVSVFMFGLGVGSLAGGYLQKRFPGRLLHLFLFLEIAIGLFGLVSLPMIHQLSALSGAPSTAQLALWVYLVLAFPTLMMGATLPVLVSWLQGYLHNMGKSVGLLYAFNALGSAIAAFCTVQVLFVFFGQQVSLLIAALCNLATAALIFDASKRIRRQAADLPAPPVLEHHADAPAKGRKAVGLPWLVTFAILLSIGFLSLSQEILWFRLLGFMTAGLPDIFGLVVAAVLAGIAAGSLASKNKCDAGGRPFEHLVRALGLATIVFYLALPVVAWTSAIAGKDIAVLIAYFLIALVAFYTGGILPLLIHLGMADSRGDKAQAMSGLYFANIIGATLGPLITGFVLLDHFSLEQNIVLLSGVAAALLLALVLAIPKPVRYKLQALALGAGMAGIGWLTHGALYEQHLEKLQYASLDVPSFKHTLQNRDGILTVEAGPQDIMYGGGIYDGRFNLDPIKAGNGIDRALMLASLHRKPETILEIGLSTGSWARMVSKHRALKEMTIVEINPGYLALMAHYPDIAEITADPKISMVFDDGRRWLRRNPDKRFDFVLMNTSFHWRSNSSNLLSAEFLELVRQHLKPGGVFYYNTTGSRDVAHTAAHVFKYVTMYKRFIACSDTPFDMTELERRAGLLAFTERDGSPVLQADRHHEALLDHLASIPLPDMRSQLLSEPGLWRVTDDNMAVEYKVPRIN